jgi:iron-sulfur cluster repair protein YtfE (RIC family)
MPSSALDLLRTDHREVDTMFEQFDTESGEAMASSKADLALTICAELKVHAQIEEEIFYPEVRKSVPDTAELLDEAVDEHAEAKQQISRIEACDPTNDKDLSSLVRELAEMIRHHVREEENEMFPKVQASSMDLATIGNRLEERKQQLQASPPPGGPSGRSAGARR